MMSSQNAAGVVGEPYVRPVSPTQTLIQVLKDEDRSEKVEAEPM
jgi:hypothetical protein